MNLTDSTIKISLPWKWMPMKRKMVHGCPLFQEGDALLQTAWKAVPLETGEIKTDKDIDVEKKKPIVCGAVGCSQTFPTLISYENHYQSQHRHICVTCHRTLPSSHLLDLHIQENHDPFFAILASRQCMFQCLVESCGEKFASANDRRNHLVTLHHYPSNFRFHRLHTPSSAKKRPCVKKKGKTMDVDDPDVQDTSSKKSPEAARALDRPPERSGEEFPKSTSLQHSDPNLKSPKSSSLDSEPMSPEKFPSNTSLLLSDPELISPEKFPSNTSLLHSDPELISQEKFPSNTSLLHSDPELISPEKFPSNTSLLDSNPEFISPGTFPADLEQCVQGEGMLVGAVDSVGEKENIGPASETRKGIEWSAAMEVVDDLNHAASELLPASQPHRVFIHKVPQNFSFGHGVGRGFQRPPGKKKKRGGHWHQRGAANSREMASNIENVDMADMQAALNDV